MTTAPITGARRLRPAGSARMSRTAEQLPAAAQSLAFECFGVVAEVVSDDLDLVESLPSVLPPGWRPRNDVDCGTSFGAMRDGTITVDGVELMHIDGGAETTLAALASTLRQHLALHAPVHVFIHAGVACVNGAAIVIPGGSRAGKTTLVAELVRAGATYCSDEYAVVDQDGMIHAYAKPLSIRASGAGRFGLAVTVPESQTERAPARAALIVVTSYQPDAEWRPATLTRAQGALALLQHTVAARARPRDALRAVRDLAQTAHALASPRGEARAIAADLLEIASGSLTRS